MSERIKKIDELIKRQLNEIIKREIEFHAGVLATIERVETSGDLSQTKVLMAVFPEEQLGNVLRILNSQRYNLHKVLNKKLTLRKIPSLRFVQDKQLAKEQKVEGILGKVV